MSRFDRNAFLRAGIILVWAAGLSLGFAAARSYGDALCDSVQMAPAKQPTFFGALAVNGLPLLISALAVFFHRSALYVVALLRGFCLGLGLMAVSASYAGAGLMMSVLLLFSSLAYGPVLLWYWCRAYTPESDFCRDTLVCGLVELVICAADVWIVSPLLREIVIF